jgi:small nuclear ribonucleoprotein (snRNP)-like protein
VIIQLVIDMSDKRGKKATLAVFLQALQGSQCIVELQNDSVIKGALESVDRGMNIVMKNAVIKDVYGRMRSSESLHVRSSAVRYVHLAAGVDPSTAVRTHERRLQVARRENYTRQQGIQAPKKGDH